MFRIGPHESESRIILDLSTFHAAEDLASTQKIIGAQFAIGRFRPTFTTQIEANKLLAKASTLGLHVLPSTFGCLTPEDAVSTAMLAAEQRGCSVIVLHVMGCPKNGFPDGEGTLEAARELVHRGLDVVPVCIDDPILCQRLAQIGCAAAVVTGTTPREVSGIPNPQRIRLIRASIEIPLILAYSFGCASDAARAMELGVDGVIIDAASARAGNPTLMPRAFNLAVQSGRIAHEAVHSGTEKKGTMSMQEKGNSAWR